MLPQLREHDSFIDVSEEEGTWIASLGILMSPVSALLVGPAIDAFGRKKGLQFFYLCMGLGFGVTACATNVFQIYLGRCLCAFAIRMEVAAVVYLAEITTEKQRGCFFAVTSAIFTGGACLTYAVGALPWNVASAMFSFTSFCCFVFESFTPESPAWLYKAGRSNSTTKSLRTLGRSPANIEQELQLLCLSSSKSTEKFRLRALAAPEVWKPFVIITLFHLLECGAGTFHILYYSVDFVEALDTSYDAFYVSTLIAVVRFVSTATLGAYFIGAVSRRFAAAFSSFWMAVAAAGTAACEYHYRDVPGTPHQWIPVSLVSISIIASSIGINCLPWLMPGEMFPLQVRGAMTGACFLMGTGMMFITLKLYAFCVNNLEIWGLLMVFAGFSTFGVFFGAFVLPETQHKTLYEVQQGFLPRRKRHMSFEAARKKMEAEA